MLRFMLPDDDVRWEERVLFRCLPLADCVLALWLIAHEQRGEKAATRRLAALRDMLTVSQMRTVAEQFGQPCAPGMVALDVIAGLPDGSDFDALLAALRAVPEHVLVGHVLREAGTLTADAPRGHGVWLSLIADPAWASEYIRRFVHPAPSDSQRLLQIIARPAPVREALVALFHDLKPVLAPLLAELSAVGAAADARLREEFARDPERFSATHLPFGIWSGAALRAVFWPSAFLRSGWISTPIDEQRVTLVAYGTETVREPPQRESVVPGAIVPEVAPAGTYQDVYRLLADPARWSLIQLLVAAPRYGQELSELLGLSIATVSHHLNGLKRLDLVDIQRDEHRLYYHLRTDRLRALLAGAEQGLLMQYHMGT